MIQEDSRALLGKPSPSYQLRMSFLDDSKIVDEMMFEHRCAYSIEEPRMGRPS